MKGNCGSQLVYHHILGCQFPITFHLTSFLAEVWINKKESQKLSVELIYKKDHGALSLSLSLLFLLLGEKIPLKLNPVPLWLPPLGVFKLGSFVCLFSIYFLDPFVFPPGLE